MLSWLERGLPPDTDAVDEDGAGAITEFLVASLQPKGAESGSAKAWVDKARRERESQETRRLLYVAATRAREELHLFARPEYKTAEDQSLALIPSTGSLLATAWPGLREAVRDSFDAWCAERSRKFRPRKLKSRRRLIPSQPRQRMCSPCRRRPMHLRRAGNATAPAAEPHTRCC